MNNSLSAAELSVQVKAHKCKIMKSSREEDNCRTNTNWNIKPVSFKKKINEHLVESYDILGP